MDKADVNKLNTTSLAYIGDAVYEVYVRAHVMRKDAAHTDALHRRAIAFVRAEGQAACIKKLVKEHAREVQRLGADGCSGMASDMRADSEKALDPRGADEQDGVPEFHLTAQEASLVRRARNRKSATKPKHVDPITYKWATAFEALAGYLYLTEQTERLDLFAAAAIAYIENGLRQK